MAGSLNNSVDIKENYIYQLDKSILEILLRDRTSGKNILWATDMYSFRGEGYQPQDYIIAKAITGLFGNVIKPRIKKSQREQRQRVKSKAEVFTPSWICAAMANSLDETWFDRTNVFNVPQDKSWTSTHDKITFPSDKTWQDYVNLKVMEITCGEAPFLVSRYDTVTGQWLSVHERIGLLDRKLRIVSENVDAEPEWVRWAYQAYKSTYGYEWQGDSVLIARENLLFTFIDYYVDKFKNFPINKYLIELSKIISWNIWQMDGLKNTIPNYAKSAQQVQMSFLDNEQIDNLQDCNGVDVSADVYCKIKIWQTNRTIKFDNIKATVGNNKGENKMKFDFVIGNPPYQETKSKSETQTQANSNWVYYTYQFAADKIAKCSCLIYPFGGWFDSPSSLNGLGNTILKDGRTVFIHAYEGTSDKRAWYRSDKLPCPLFSSANLSAGISIVLRTANKRSEFEFSNRIYTDEVVTVNIDETDDLTPNPLFAKIGKKLVGQKLCDNIRKSIFGIESNFVELNPDKASLKKQDWERPILLLTNDKSGSSGRTKKFYTNIENIPKGKEYFGYYKVIMTSAYPKQKLTLGIPTIENVKKRVQELIEILPPNSAFGCSRMLLYMSKSEDECDNFIKYTKTTFFAGLTLQEPNRRSSFGNLIPMQDFSQQSDIDWSKSLQEIDLQLYAKYKLTDEEIGFIEKRIGEND